MTLRWYCVKWAALAVAVASVLLTLLLLWQSSVPLLQQADDGDVAPARQTAINKPLIVERDGERIIWRLRAEDASQQQGRMLLQQPELELFTGSGEIVMIRSQQAWFAPAQRDIDFRQQVSVDYRDWHLTTERLLYLSSQDVAVVPGNFKAAGHDARVTGRDLRAERASERISISHDVRVHDLQYAPTLKASH